MLDQKELHIGCWYNFSNPMTGDITPIRFSSWTEAVDFEAYGTPIELSPEWLDKMGFVYRDGASEYGTYRRDNTIELYEHDDNPGIFHFSNGLFHGRQVEIKYVHQLQNLYYANIGEELTIKTN